MKLQFAPISSVLALCGALALAGCATGGGPSATSEAPISNTLAVTAINPEDLVSYSNTIVVPTAYVKLLGKAVPSPPRRGALKSVAIPMPSKPAPNTR